MAFIFFARIRSLAGRRRAPPRRVPTAMRSYAAHASKTQVWHTASARATIGGPSRDSRTPWRNASFHRITTLRWSCFGTAGTASAGLRTRSGSRSEDPTTPALHQIGHRGPHAHEDLRLARHLEEHEGVEPGLFHDRPVGLDLTRSDEHWPHALFGELRLQLGELGGDLLAVPAGGAPVHQQELL